MSRPGRMMFAVACAGLLAVAPAAGEKPPARPNIVIVCLNCLDKARLGLSGHGARTTPNLDRFAEGAYVFTNLVAPATFTPPVIAELFSSRFYDGPVFVGGPGERKAQLSETAAGRYLISIGYSLVDNEGASAPEKTGPEPFFQFVHPRDLHPPFDKTLDKERLFEGTDAVRYRNGLRGVTRFAIFHGTSRPATNFCQAVFGRELNLLPDGDASLWNGLLADAREPARGVPHELLRWALRPSEWAALNAPGRNEPPSPEEQAAIVRALNRLVTSPRTPLKRILVRMPPDSPDHDARSGAKIQYLDTLFTRTKETGAPARDDGAEAKTPYVNTLSTRLKETSPLVRGAGGRYRIKAASADARRRLELLYCELLEAFFPVLKNTDAKEVRRVSLAAPDWDDRSNADSDEPAAISSMRAALYDDALRGWDAAFGDFLEKWRKSGLLDRTILVVMGDHGEAFGEHDQSNHSEVDCYDELINPALVVRLPGAPERKTVVRAQLRTMDVLPTLLDLAGLGPVPAKYGALDGLSVAPALSGASVPIIAFSRNARNTWAIRMPDGWKLIWNLSDDWKKLFNLNEDPGERTDVSEQFPERRADLEQRLERHIYAVLSGPGQPAGGKGNTP